MKSVLFYYRVDRRRINFIRFIFEAYEGLAVVTTLDAAKGTIVLAVAPQCTDMALGVMADLGRTIQMEVMDAAQAPALPY